MRGELHPVKRRRLPSPVTESRTAAWVSAPGHRIGSACDLEFPRRRSLLCGVATSASDLGFPALHYRWALTTPIHPNSLMSHLIFHKNVLCRWSSLSVLGMSVVAEAKKHNALAGPNISPDGMPGLRFPRSPTLISWPGHDADDPHVPSPFHR